MLYTNRIARLIVLATASLAASILLVNWASAGTKGSETKGRAYYRQLCKDCHTKGAKGGEVSPLTKTQAQWRIYFRRGSTVAAARCSPSLWMRPSCWTCRRS